MLASSCETFMLTSGAHFQMFHGCYNQFHFAALAFGLAAECQKDLNWVILVKLGLLPSANSCLLISHGKLILDWATSELISLSADQTALEVFPSLN